MRLRSKFLLTVGAVLTLAFGFTFYRSSQVQYQLVLSQAERQARMLASQIILTRKWVADHNGIFLVKAPGTEANPFLDEAEVSDRKGITYVKRNPAMVTRELADYATNADFWTFRVTSLKPVNPNNAPDAFETSSLKRFEQGEGAIVAIDQAKNGRVLRYITPLVVEESCLECHARHGYKVGDIRGALSLSIPMAWADQLIAGNKRTLVGIAMLTIVLVGAVLYLLLDIMVVRRLALLASAMERFPENDVTQKLRSVDRDEIGMLAGKFVDLAHRLQSSQAELERAKEMVFQAEKMAALGRLSAGIAHEVNNPLGGMLNCVKSMKEAPENRNLRERYLELLEKGLRRLEKTMRQLLNFGRRESLKLQNLSVQQIIEECLALMEYRLKNIDLQREDSFRGSCLLDGEALRQVLVNIIINALEAMPEGGRLTIATGRRQNNLVISVSDSGEGISREHIRHIFEPFFTTREVGRGTGLGLAVSFALIDRMGGRIEVESEPGHGSRFDIILPIREEDRQEMGN